MKNIKIHNIPSANTSTLKRHRKDGKTHLHINSNCSGLRPMREVSKGLKEALLRHLSLWNVDLPCDLLSLCPQDGPLHLLSTYCQRGHMQYFKAHTVPGSLHTRHLPPSRSSARTSASEAELLHKQNK